MIHLDKPNETPHVLLNRGNAETQQNCEAYVGDPAAYGSGELKFTFIDSIYGPTKIRKVLEKLQDGKCCYCESKPLATSAGRIDHFRPKGSVRQSKGSDRIYPGYYWLAYRWDNLVLACEKCNLNKSDYFPLEDPGQRARNHQDPLDRESPLLLNPYIETVPSEHLTFVGSVCHSGTERGRVTVAVLGLNRPELQEERKRVLDVLECLCHVVSDPNRGDTLCIEASRMVDSHARPDASYSAMARDYLSAIDAENENRT